MPLMTAADDYRAKVNALDTAKTERDALQAALETKTAEIETLRQARDTAYEACLTEVQKYGKSKAPTV